MSLQKPGKYRYSTATKEEQDKQDKWWEWAVYYYEHYIMYLRGEEEEIDELIEFHPEGRREVDIYTYLMGYIKGVFPDPFIHYGDFKNIWDKDYTPVENTKFIIQQGNMYYTENSDIYRKLRYQQPDGTSYFNGESIRVHMCG